MALAADVAIAAEDAIFFLSQVSLGIIPAAGGISRLAHKVGAPWASRLVLTGERIDARKAEQIGLVTEVVEPERLRERAFELAAAIAAQPREAAHLAKDALTSVHDMPLNVALKLDRYRVFPLFAAEQ
jgi:enoyl-CoA hydratase